MEPRSGNISWRNRPPTHPSTSKIFLVEYTVLGVYGVLAMYEGCKRVVLVMSETACNIMARLTDWEGIGIWLRDEGFVGTFHGQGARSAWSTGCWTRESWLTPEHTEKGNISRSRRESCAFFILSSVQRFLQGFWRLIFQEWTPSSGNYYVSFASFPLILSHLIW